MDIQSYIPTRETIKGVLNRKVEDLPTLPVVAVKLLKITRDDRSSASDLVKVVETDPGITAKVLKIVNSAAYGFRSKISSVNQAVIILGFNSISTLALEVTLFEQMVRSNRGKEFDRIFFWQHCLSVASLSMALAEETGHPAPEEVYTAGLLHDIGKIILDVYGRISYREFVKNLPQSDTQMVEEERKLIGLGHDEVGAYFCAKWELPEELLLPVRFHHQRFNHLNISPLRALEVAIVALADFITWTQGIGSINIIRHPILPPEIDEIIDLGSIDWRTLIERVDREVKTTAEFYEFTFPTSDQFRENLLRANIRLSRMNSQFYHLKEDVEKRLNGLNRMKKSLTTPHRSLDTDEIMSSTLDAIHKDFGFDRSYIMKIDPDRRCLITRRYQDNSGLGVDLASMVMTLSPLSGGFLECLRKNTPMLIMGRTSGETEFLEILRAREIGVVPISNNKQIIGLLGIDNARTNKPIASAALYAVAIVANELGIALENARLFEEIKTRAYVDGLTKVNNRRSLDDFLAEAFHKTVKDNGKLSLIMVDIDHFKHFNDTFGHLAGDSVLELLGGTLNKFSRPTDHVGRYGGEEFMIILADTDFPETFRCAERLRKEIEDLGKLLARRFPGPALTVSIGVASFQPLMKRKEDLIAKSDRALYLAKECGRNRVMSCHASSDQRSEASIDKWN